MAAQGSGLRIRRLLTPAFKITRFTGERFQHFQFPSRISDFATARMTTPKGAKIAVPVAEVLFFLRAR
jgi:hypothetical protein